MPRLIFYSKPNCPLCDHALEQVELARREIPFDLEEINILSDLEIYERCKSDIPVGVLNGRVIFKYRTTAPELIALLKSP